MRRIQASVFTMVISLILFAPLLLADQDWSEDKQFRYCHVPLDQNLPSGFTFFLPVALNNRDQVAGVLFDEDFVTIRVGIWEDGAFTVFRAGDYPIGDITSFNDHRIVGGSVLIDPVSFLEQAALFRANGVTLLPLMPGEFASRVRALNNRNSVLVESAEFPPTYWLFRNQNIVPLSISDGPIFLGMNDREALSWTSFDDARGVYRGVFFDTRTGRQMQLNPLPTEPDAWTMGINNRGEVLGYSFVPGALERIGIWDRFGVFRTYFVEGTTEIPTVSDRLRFNNDNLIVITRVVFPSSDFDRSYLVPRPGVRLDLASLVENLPEGTNVGWIDDLNDRGNLIGFSLLAPGNLERPFLLQRLERDEGHSRTRGTSCTVRAKDVSVRSRLAQHSVSSSLAAMLRRRIEGVSKLEVR